MGLDTVELVMEVEDAFGVAIPNDAAANIRTVGDLHQCVLALHRKRPNDGTTRCPSAAAFYKTRSALMAALGMERKGIRPETPLDEVFPWRSRVTRYKAWTRAMTPWRTPHLRWSPWLAKNAVVLTAGASFMVSLGYFLTTDLGSRHALVAGFVWIGSWLGSLALLEVCVRKFGLGRHFPPACRTVGDLSQTVLLANPALAAPGPAMTDDFAWRMLVPIVSAQLGVPEGQIHPHSRFVEDLHAD